MQQEFLLINASYNGNVERVRMLLADGRSDPLERDSEAIRYASEHGNAEVVRMLLEDRRADPAAVHNQAIQMASKNGHAEVVRMLLDDPRTNPAARDNEAIRIASRYGHIEIVRMFLADGRADPADVIRNASNDQVIRLLLQDERVRSALGANIPIEYRAIWSEIMQSQ